MRPSDQRSRAFTELELLFVILGVCALAMIAVGLILPSFGGSHKAPRIRCISNLKQVGLAFRIWSGDHGEKFPMALSTNEGGSMEFINGGEVLPHLLAISNELNNPKVLTCPSDKRPKPAKDFSVLAKRNLSYFVGLDADEQQPKGLLSGDRNITTDGKLTSGLLILTTNNPAVWTEKIHLHAGNLGYGDGSAEQVSDVGLRKRVEDSPILPYRLVIP
jgi:hypothetical protein